MNYSDVVIVGSGPAGLATAIAAKNTGLSYRVFEKAVLVNTILRFPINMVFFTTPELLELGGLPFVSPYEKPTRVEALSYYRRVVDTYNLQIEFGREVIGIAREKIGLNGTEGLAVETQSGSGSREVHHAFAVVLATGCYDNPNMLAVPGEDLPYVSHYYDEVHAYYRKRVVIVGGKNSAAEAALELYRGGAHVTLIHRGNELGDSIKYWVRPDIENRIREGSVIARFETQIVEIKSREIVVEHKGTRNILPADAVFLLTGYHTDGDLLTRFGIKVDPVTSKPEHDLETLETNVPGLYLAGTVVSGIHSAQIFIENGRFHGATVVKQIQKQLQTREKR